jgi:hypothetical protein
MLRINKANEPVQRDLHIRLQVEAGLTRRDTFMGVEYLVVPTVALIEGVIWPSNAESRELALAEEFGRYPAGWNGRPIVMGHPKLDGVPVSANLPQILEEWAFGYFFNVHLEDSKLKGEMWLDIARANAKGGDFKTAIEKFEAGEVVEVSTGLFMTLEERVGVKNGLEYGGVWRNVVPDHLAVLLDAVGACSIEMGCGGNRINTAAPTTASGGCKCGGACMTKPNNQSIAVHITGNPEPLVPETVSPEAEQGKKGFFEALMDKLGEKMAFKANVIKQPELIANALSDNDIRKALQAALKEVHSDCYCWIVAVFPDSVVYERGYDGNLYRRSYSVSETGTVSISSEEMQVRPVTEFVPVDITINSSTTLEAESMDKSKNKSKVDSLIANAKSGYTEEDRKTLEDLDPKVLDKIVANANKEPETPAPVAEPTPPAPVVNNQTAAPKKAQTVDEYIASAPAELQGVLREGLKLQEDRKNSLVTSIMGFGERNAFSEQELRAMEVSQLERLAKLGGNVIDYSTRAPANLPTANQGKDESFTPAPGNIWEQKSA